MAEEDIVISNVTGLYVRMPLLNKESTHLTKVKWLLTMICPSVTVKTFSETSIYEIKVFVSL